MGFGSDNQNNRGAMMSDAQSEPAPEPSFVVITQDMIDMGGWPQSFLGMTVINGGTQSTEGNDDQ